MQKLFKYLDKYAVITNEAKAALERAVIKKKISKSQVLLYPNDVCKYLYLIESGFLRGFYLQDSRDITSWFAFENDIAASMYSFVSQKPGFEGIEALEDTCVYSIEYSQLQHIYRNHVEMNIIGRSLTEKYYILLEERKNALQHQPAIERYRLLIKKQPQVLLRASLGMIASYLGISQETLSRIRNKI